MKVNSYYLRYMCSPRFVLLRQVLGNCQTSSSGILLEITFAEKMHNSGIRAQICQLSMPDLFHMHNYGICFLRLIVMRLPSVMHLHRSPSLENKEFLLGMEWRSSFINGDRISKKDLLILGSVQYPLILKRPDQGHKWAKIRSVSDRVATSEIII